MEAVTIRSALWLSLTAALCLAAPPARAECDGLFCANVYVQQTWRHS